MPDHESPFFLAETAMWFAMSLRAIVGPIFFENAINSERNINTAHESQYCIYEFRQNGPCSLVYDVINIHNTWFSLKKFPVCYTCMYTSLYMYVYIYILLCIHHCVKVHRYFSECCDIVIRSPTSYPVCARLYFRLAGWIIYLNYWMILSISYTKLLSSYHQQVMTAALHSISPRQSLELHNLYSLQCVIK